jgi:hypothetical protein
VRRESGHLAPSTNFGDRCHNDAGLATARVNCSVFTLTALGPKEAEMRIRM